MKPTLFALLLLAALAAALPGAAAADVSGLEKALGSTQIQQAGAIPPAALGTIEEILKATDEAIQSILKKGSLTQEDLERINKILDEGVKAVEKLRTAGGTTTKPGDKPADPGRPAEKVEAGYVDVNTRLNVRDGAWGKIIGKLGRNDKVEIVGQEGDWYKIKYKDGYAFVHSRYVRKGDAPAGPSYKGYVKSNCGGLNVRSAPWGAIVGQLSPGDKVTVTGRDGEWCVIAYDGGRAYVHSDYIGKGEPPADGGNDTVETKPGPDGFTFPVGVAGNKFCDTWGAARSGGRRHEGTDIFNQRNSPLVACRDGKVGSTSPNSLGGNCVRVTGNNGVYHYYAHLERVGNVRPGQPIKAGQVVGYMGNTGNARTTPVHLHFGMYRNNVAFNPYPTLHASYPWGKH